MTEICRLAEAASNRASELEDANDIAGAIRAMSEAVELAPNDFLYQTLRGRLYNLQENWRAAIHDFDNVIAAKPKASSALYSRGLAKYMSDDLEGAIADLERCIELEPGAEDAWGLLGDVHNYRRDWEAALRAYERSRDLRTNERPDLDDLILKMQEKIWLRDNGEIERKPSQARTPIAARDFDKKKALELSDKLYEILTHRRQNTVAPYQRKRLKPAGSDS